MIGHAYDSAIALDPPIKGSYPVAGNGPNVLQEIQRSRAQREALHGQRRSCVAEAPKFAEVRDESDQRPHTAPPHDGRARGRRSSKSWTGRTHSALLTKSPPRIKSSIKSRSRSSIRSTLSAEQPPVPALPMAMAMPAPIIITIPAPTPPPTSRPRLQTYQPRKDKEPEGEPERAGRSAAPSVQQVHVQSYCRNLNHSRSRSLASYAFHQSSHVDLFEAHSSIRPSREASEHRVQASGLRNYGEDVADRNIDRFSTDSGRGSGSGKGDWNSTGMGSRIGSGNGNGIGDVSLGRNSPSLSCMKHVYAPKTGARPIVAGAGAGVGVGAHSRTSSASGYVLGHNGPSDDIPRSHRKSTSASIPRARRAAPAPAPAPAALRRENTTRSTMSDTTSGQVRQEGPSFSSAAPEQTTQTSSSPLQTSQFVDDDLIMRDSLRRLFRPKSYQPRGRERTAKEPPPGAALAVKPVVASAQPMAPRVVHGEQPAAGVNPQSAARHVNRNAPTPVAAPEDIPRQQPPLDDAVKRILPTDGTSGEAPFKEPPAANGYTTKAPAVAEGHAKAKSGSRGSPQAERTDLTVRNSLTNETNKRQGMIVENSSTPVSLDGVVDLTNTVDSDITTKTLPAVIHEHVTPIQHNIREERITRTTHTHEYRKRILPVLDTEILPTKHYIHSPDGKGLIEISESEVYRHKVSGSMNNTWSLSQTSLTPHSRASSLATQALPDYAIVEDDVADSPIIGFARGESSHARANSPTTKLSRVRNMFTEPVLTSKKESITTEGIPRTEYVWHHPPVIMDALEREQPMYLGAGLGDTSNPAHRYSGEFSGHGVFM
ncbi:hypothetical protein BUE80_DR013586 [Diplocarpon rosae]|nr:hypothetical protein BUE80_DR013586 [Diplocarpon rosae]